MAGDGQVVLIVPTRCEAQMRGLEDGGAGSASRPDPTENTSDGSPAATRAVMAATATAHWGQRDERCERASQGLISTHCVLLPIYEPAAPEKGTEVNVGQAARRQRQSP